MSFDCRLCPDYTHCISPCADVRQYINMDHVKRSRREICTEIDRDILNGDYKSYIYTRMKQIERIKGITPEHKQILKMSVAGITQKEIAKKYGYTRQRIQQIIAYYKGK